MDKAVQEFQRFYDIIRTLRGPEGCPWDREQTVTSLAPFLIEESFECVDEISSGSQGGTREELGDVFLIALMIAYVGEQDHGTPVSSVFAEISDKLVRRHPHVFGDAQAENAGDVKEQWERIKRDVEGRDGKGSRLEEVSKSLPPLERAYRLQKKAAKAGFDWPDERSVLEKIREEVDELGTELDSDGARSKQGPDDSATDDPVAEELGDLLFSVINLARYRKLDPSLLMHRANEKFAGRFRHVEHEMHRLGVEMSHENMAEMDAAWDRSKTRGTPSEEYEE
jgi:tetrapyrrole methylase family protein/MazG family protein